VAVRAALRPVGLLFLALLTDVLASAGPSTATDLAGTVVAVVDGDSIHVRVEGRIEKIRYIGVNTPEVRHPTKGEEPGGREAAAVNRRLVEGKQVRLELDVQRRDQYGRLLAYVWVDALMVNAELVRQGYAQVMTVPPNVRYQTLFVALQREARAARRGLLLGGGLEGPLRSLPQGSVAPAKPALERR
jgi:micrococcal nuclease